MKSDKLSHMMSLESAFGVVWIWKVLTDEKHEIKKKKVSHNVIGVQS